MGAIPDTGRPASDEYDPFYETYVGLVPETSLDEVLDQQLEIVANLIAGLSESKADHRYAPGKWSIREVIGHVIDTEWVFSNRALWFARGNPGPLPGMDQDDFARASVYDGVALPILAEQFQSIRAAGLAQYRTFSEQILGRRGTASGGEVSVRALLYILAGHLRHHLRVLKDRYLVT